MRTKQERAQLRDQVFAFRATAEIDLVTDVIEELREDGWNQLRYGNGEQAKGWLDAMDELEKWLVKPRPKLAE